jgi:para-nitrobenzyl esterase
MISRRILLGWGTMGAIAYTVAKASPGLAEVPDPNAPLVTTVSGKVRGYRKNGLNVFTGIPFGATTAGKARFRAPEPVTPWSGIFDATRTARISPQTPIPNFPELPGVPSEDCLQLNVWAPSTPGPHPVLVWAHGGGNHQGSCAEPLYDGSVFAQQGIVYVNFNYRLGALGFLELGQILGPEYRGSANNALRDHLLALQWVKQNIAAFGGDANQITLAGESAGGYNLLALLGVPTIKNLVNRMIIASGGQGTQELVEADAFAKFFVDELGGPERLHSASFNEIVAAQWRISPLWPHRMAIRSVVDGVLIPRSPMEAVAAGAARDISLLIGVCRDEAASLIPKALANRPEFHPPTVWLDLAKMPEVIRRYKAAYPRDSRSDTIYRLVSAEMFGVPSFRMADAQVGAGGRVHKYRLDYTVETGPHENKSAHGFDVPMAFQKMDGRLAHSYGLSPVDQPMADVVHQMWVSFVRNGEVDANLPAWPAYDLRTRKTMILDRKSYVGENVDRIDREIWKDLF